jgi:plasmid stabilization system protein ParE
MTYSVAWTPDATADLMELWVSVADKEAVSAATQIIETILKVNPLHERHEVVQGYGTALHGPIGVDFRVDPVRELVVVTTVWQAS